MHFIENCEDKLRISYEHNLCDNLIKSTNLNTSTNKTNKENIIHTLLSSNEMMIKYILYSFPQVFELEDECIFLSYLRNADTYIKFKSCEILTDIYSDKIPKHEYLQFIKHNLYGHTYEQIDQILYFLVQLLYNKKDSIRVENSVVFNRNIVKMNFCRDGTFIGHLRKLILVKEVQYNALKIFFILSYDRNCLKILEEKKVIEEVLKVLKSKSSEKIMRICVSIIRNFLFNKYTFTIMTSQDIVHICSESQYIDIEMLDEMKFIHDVLLHHLNTSSNIDSYFKELFGGKLEEAPYHYSNSFWENNLVILLANKSEIIKAIKRHLKSNNNTYVCVAANDLYRFVRVAPEIRVSVEKYGVKDDLFFLLNNSNTDIKYYCIQALSFCICGEWIYK